MSFRDVPLLRYYKTYKNNVVKEFYTPVLKEAVLYQRAVGFFTSGALIDLTKGLKGLTRNQGKIQFIVSPRLSEEDIEAINKGYEHKEIIGRALMRDFKEPENYFEEERLNFLAYLIEEGFLDIKVAFTPPNKSMGMYHEKVGIVTDKNGNKIVFTGSLNETINAFHLNSESIVVFKSWEESKVYVDDIQEDFEQLWNKQGDDLEILDFPKVLKHKFEVMRKPDLDFFLLKKSCRKRKKNTMLVWMRQTRVFPMSRKDSILGRIKKMLLINGLRMVTKEYLIWLPELVRHIQVSELLPGFMKISKDLQ